ncbi:MAG TPA: DUF4242 domain-containing protein [Puia sp.]|jgi:hypothetical protein|nr:DUF4242 domain-containing protein [Puia sp.]
MKKFAKHLNVLILSMLLTGFACMAQSSVLPNNDKNKREAQNELKTYVIERNIPGAGQFTAEKLKSISETSCTVLKEMGPGIQWIHSYVTDNKIFCVYKAENIEMIKEHAKRGGFPVNAVYEVSTVISPATAN